MMALCGKEPEPVENVAGRQVKWKPITMGTEKWCAGCKGRYDRMVIKYRRQVAQAALKAPPARRAA